MKKRSIRKCPICEEIEVEILHKQSFVLPQGHPLARGYDVVACDRCGLVYADTNVTQDDYDRFYSQLSKYEDNLTSTGGGESSCDAARLQQTAACIAEFIPDRNARILDIGCANGGLLNHLQKLGYVNLAGLDPSAVCVNHCRQVYGIEASVGSLFSEVQNLGEFDCAILSHVLEHVQDLKLAATRLGRLIKPNGCIYIEVPNATLYADCAIAPFQDFNTEHINHFSQTSLSNLLELLGFQSKLTGEKVFNSSPGMPYPAIYSFWIKQASKPSVFSFTPDRRTLAKISEYIEISQKILGNIEIKLQPIAKDGREAIVWGTGQLAMKLLAETSLAKAKIAAFVDGNPMNQGQVLAGIPVLAPDRIKGMKQPIIVTSILHQEAIAERIAQMNLPNEVIFLG